MAQKRMFDKTITNNDNFLEMPDSTQNLYFHLSMEADDDGFVDNWKSIMRMTGKKNDDLKLLIAKSFIIPFETGVIVIKHWRINNYLRKDRYHQTKYLKEKSLLTIEENEAYELKKDGGIPIGNREENSIEENSIEENSIEEYIGQNKQDTLYDFLQKELGRTLSSTEIEKVKEWEDNELTRYAVKTAILNGAYTINYIDAIIYNWQKLGIKSVSQAQEETKRHRDKKISKKIEHKPEWFDDDIKKEEVETNENNEMEELLKDFK
jgi:DnaD/phage-associated family protein